MELIFDDDQFAKVARAIVRYNKYKKGMAVVDVVNHMKAVARETFIDATAGYVATGGFALSLYLQYGDKASDKYGVYASVAECLFDGEGRIGR